MRRALQCVAAVVLVFTGGCRPDPVPTPAPTSPQRPAWADKLADFRFRWTAEAGMSLDTGWAVPLRAYLESRRRTYYTPTANYTPNLDAAYPGYLRATPEPLVYRSPEWKETPSPQRDIRADTGTPGYVTGSGGPVQGVAGNEDLHVLRIEPLSSGFRAFVCDATYRVYKKTSNTSQFLPVFYEANDGPFDPDLVNTQVWRIEFSDRDPRAGTTPPAPTTPQRGPSPTPRDDVFGPWFVTGAEFAQFWSDVDYPGLEPDSPEAAQRRQEAQEAVKTRRQQCIDHYPLDRAQRTKLATTILDAPPPVEPAQPGWPQ
ncbi:hypothetical protein BI330_09040 [Mycobacterium sp. CBMA 623]|nr:hypothetical protein [Mycobacteroides sp. CBMA 326]